MASSPVTGGNWEGAGVLPEVAVAADVALEHAHRLALKQIRKSETDEDRRHVLDDLIDAAGRRLGCP